MYSSDSARGDRARRWADIAGAVPRPVASKPPIRHRHTMRLRSSQMLADYISLLGLSERAFAARCELSHSTINHLIVGRRNTCSLATATAIETALQCSPGLIFVPAPPAGKSQDGPVSP